MNEKVAKEKKLSTHKVCIDINPGSVPELKRVFYVRHYDPRQARAWLLEHTVTSERAEESDIIKMVKAGIEPIGPFEKSDPANDSQPDLLSDTRIE